MMKIIKALLLSAVLGLSAAVLAAVDINLANQEELQQLKGIGAKKAADIIAYREANGRFGSCAPVRLSPPSPGARGAAAAFALRRG